jgi:hypothetical protein
VPRNVLPEAVLLVLVRSDVNVVLPPVECVLGDGGIATLVTIFSVPSVPANIGMTTDIIEINSNSKQKKNQHCVKSHRSQILSGIGSD